MPKLMLGTVVVLDSMVGLAKDMVDTEAMVFNKQHTDSEPIPIMVDTDVLMEAMVDTEPMELVLEVTDDSGEKFYLLQMNSEQYSTHHISLNNTKTANYYL